MDTSGEVYGGKRYLGSWDGHVHIAMFKWITNKVLLNSTGNYAQC